MGAIASNGMLESCWSGSHKHRYDDASVMSGIHVWRRQTVVQTCLTIQAACMNSPHKQVLFIEKCTYACTPFYKLLASASITGASSSTCEASFSARTRVLTTYRRSMMHMRKADLILLAYEGEITNSIGAESFL